MNLKQIIKEEVKRQLKEFQGEGVLFSINDPKVDDFLQQRFSDYLDYATHKGDDVYVLPIKYYNSFIDQADSRGYDTDSIQVINNVNEAYGSDFDGPGLVVIGKTYSDDNRLQKFIDDNKYYGGIWNSQENYAFFPVNANAHLRLDTLEFDLSKTFKKIGIKARFESQH